MKKKIKISWFNAFLLTCGAGALLLLIHDFIFWAFVPIFTGETVMMTYTGMFVDLFACVCVDMSIQLLEEK